MVSELCADKLEEVGDDLGNGVSHSVNAKRSLVDACVEPKRGSYFNQLGGDLGGDEGQSRPVARDLDNDHLNPRRIGSQELTQERM